MEPVAVVAGRWYRPEVHLYFDYDAVHPASPAKKLRQEWLKGWIVGQHGGMARWVKRGGHWLVTAFGDVAPERALTLAGFRIDYSELAGTDLDQILSVDELVSPLTKLTGDGASALVLPRLLGFDQTKKRLGSGARWDQEYKRFVIPVASAMRDGRPVPDIDWQPNVIEAAQLSLGRVTTPAAVRAAAAAAGMSKDPLEMDAGDLARLIELVGDIPDWFGLDLFPFQRIGAIAAAAGHNGIWDEPGLGKAEPVSEPVLTPHGFRPMGDLRAGDEVIARNGRATRVLGVFPQGEQPIACVTFTDGTWTRATWDHLWQVTRSNDRARGAAPRVLTTRELLDQGLGSGGKRKWQIPMVEPVEYATGARLDFDPYSLGVLIGDGYLGGAVSVTTDDETVARMRLPEGARFTVRRDNGPGVGQWSIAGLRPVMRELGLYGHLAVDKFIPDSYLHADVASRIALLQGLLDSDGSPVSSRGKPSSTVEYGTVSPRLAAHVTELVQSLGGVATTSTKVPTYVYKGERREGQLYYRMVVALPAGIEPFRLTRKAARWVPATKYPPSRRIVSIEPDGVEQAQCIRVEDAEHLYVTRSFIVTHNTRQSLAAAAIHRSQRTLITSLPVALTHWSREVDEARLATLGGEFPDGEITIIRSGKPEPETLPDRGVVITTDSLLATRPGLRDKLIRWTPDVFIYDEAHRGKNFESTRAQAQLAISVATRKAAYPVTGTPLFANPAELAPLLEFSGHLSPVFGGLSAFYDRYTKMDPFGNRYAYKPHLEELRAKLREHVWVRRRKRDVLPDLPTTLISPKWVDVPLTQYRVAYRDVIKKLRIWLDGIRKELGGEDPGDELIQAYASSQVGLVSQLRKAAGLAKVEAIVEDIRRHVEETGEVRDGKPYFPRPLIVWAHHIEVIEALSQAVPDSIPQAGVIRGGVSPSERDRLVDGFQRHEIPVMVCSIVAAGVAITLTASSDSYFAESDYTPALIRQALDRAERIGQTADKLLATTYLAAGTLDPRVQEILKRKSRVLDAIYGEGNDVSVDIDKDSVESATEIIVGLIRDLMAGVNNP